MDDDRLVQRRQEHPQQQGPHHDEDPVTTERGALCRRRTGRPALGGQRVAHVAPDGAPEGTPGDPLGDDGTAPTAPPGPGSSMIGSSTDRCEGHQFQRPRRTTVEGTRTVRTTKVSRRTPIASAKPISRTPAPVGPAPPTMASTANEPASTRPAEVTVGPVMPTARMTAGLSGRWWASSLIRVITKML